MEPKPTYIDANLTYMGPKLTNMGFILKNAENFSTKALAINVVLFAL